MTTTLRQSILIVDDDSDIVQMVSTFLRSRGLDCTTAGTGAQGAVEFERIDADLVITDLNMPAGDGLALIDRIRRKSDVPIIVITAFSREYTEHTRRLSGVLVLRKPIDLDALMDLIRIELWAHDAA